MPIDPQERASQAAAKQRAGRAARLEPGVAYRLWEEAAHAGRPAFDPPEIETADLAPLVLTLAKWGTRDPTAAAWLDPPPEAALASARERLEASDASVETVATEAGFGSVETLRQAFRRVVGVSPTLYRVNHGRAPERGGPRRR